MELTAFRPRPQPVALTAPRILVIRPRKIGDVLLLTPALRALRSTYPECSLSVLSEPACGEVLAHHPAVNERLDYPADGNWGAYLKLVARLRGQRFDVVIDAFGSPATARLARTTQAPWRIGPRLRGRAWAYRQPTGLPRNGRYAAAVHAQLLAPLGISVDNLETDVHPTTDDDDYADALLRFLGIGAGEPVLAMAPAAGQDYKRWPAVDFARVADALVRGWGMRILLLHGPGESPQALAVRNAMRHPGAADLARTETLMQLAALLRRCRLFVGNDTGTRHIAIAAGLPTVGVFGKPRPEAWTPPGDPRHRVLTFDPGCKSHCRYPRCTLPCLREVTPRAVVAEAERLLAPPG